MPCTIDGLSTCISNFSFSAYYAASAICKGCGAFGYYVSLGLWHVGIFLMQCITGCCNCFLKCCVSFGPTAAAAAAEDLNASRASAATV